MRHNRLTRLSDSDSEDVDLTPLIDVVFVVLILFILVAPMIELDKIELAAAPAREQKEQGRPSPLMIHVRSDNTIWIDKRSLTIEQLRPVLQALHAKTPDVTPQLFQDKKAHFGTYQMVKNAVEESGFTSLDVVLEPGT